MNIEHSFIGSCLVDIDLVGTVAVKPEYFTDPLCASVWRAIQEGATDPVTICQVVGQEYERDLSGMVSHAYTHAFEKHAAQIIDNYRKRAFMFQLQTAYKKVEQGADVDSVLTEIAQSADAGVESGYKHIGGLAEQAHRDMLEMGKGNSDRFIKSGFSNLDFYMGGLERTNLVIIAGRPSQGKSALAMNICQKVAVDNKVCFSSIEMDNQSVSFRLMSSVSRMDLKLMRTGAVVSQTAMRNAENAVEQIKKLNLYVDDNSRRTASQIAAQARRHKSRNGLDVLMVDYLGLIDPESQARLPRNQQIGQITKIFKSLAKQLNICVVMLCQLNRDAQNTRPNLAQLRESGDVEQDADVCLFVYRYKEDNMEKSVVIVAKNRNGPTGDANMRWCGSTSSFEPLEARGFD